MTPKRIQRRRSKGWRLPAGAVCVTRPGRWGNHIRVINGNNRGAVALYKHWATNDYQADWRERVRCELAGRDLACWCRPCDAHKDGKPVGVECPDCAPCHVDVLIEIANGKETP
jgi:hypothetical protein